nr:MAG TPA: hypothetical protein [Caudoviricetes sp.]
MIYLIKSGNNLKIGFASNLKSRLDQYKTHNPDVRLLNYKSGTREDERNLHTLCKRYKYSNEWFIDCKEVVDIFNSYISKLDEESNFKESIKINLNTIFEGLFQISQISEYKVMIYLWKYSDIRGKIIIDTYLKDLICKETKLSIGTIKNCISSLYKKDLIIKIGNEKGLYYLNPKYFTK